MNSNKKIVVGADHAGYPLKATTKEVLASLGYEVVDVGTHSVEPVDFPDVAAKLAQAILKGEAAQGILVCGTGVGAAIASNKIPGIRAMTAQDTFTARQGVEHDDVNVLCLGAWLIGPKILSDVVKEFLGAEFVQEEQFLRRVQKLNDLENQK